MFNTTHRSQGLTRCSIQSEIWIVFQISSINGAIPSARITIFGRKLSNGIDGCECEIKILEFDRNSK